MGLSARELADLMGCSEARAARLKAAADACDAGAELDEAERLGVTLLGWGDDGYPPALAALDDAPILLYALGDPTPPRLSVAVVGTRAASPYGLRCARRLAGDLAGAGVAVISGLALGIDGAAHEGALERGGVTWAFLGAGLASVYPAEHAPLARRIADEGGCVLSEYPLHAPGMSPNHLNRNRLIAAAADLTVVVECPKKSGALDTAGKATRLGRTVAAVPGPVDELRAEGSVKLLKEGAAFVRGAQDVLDLLSGEGHAAVPSAGRRPRARQVALSLEYRKILDCVGSAAVSSDELAHATGLDASRLANILFEMELQGLVSPVPGQRYAKKAH